MNSQIVSDPMIQYVNATALFAVGVVTLILAFGFRRVSLSQTYHRALFSTLVAATVAMFTYSNCFIHHPDEHDLLYFMSSNLAYLSIYAAEFLFIRYFIASINVNRNNPVPRTELWVTLLMCLASAVLWMLSTGEKEYIIPEAPVTPYGLYFWIGHLGEWALVISCVLFLIWYGKLLRESKMLILYSVPLLMLAATFIEPLTPGLCLRYPALAIGLMIVYTQYHFRPGMVKAGSEASEVGDDFTLITNRVKPHFVNNILSTIYYLCDMDVERAKNVAMDLSGYVSGTLGAVDYEGPIPFPRELELVKKYIALESLRFGDRMTVNFETEETDFDIPYLTLQALVENAVKHGIAEKEGPGQVDIKTRRLADGSIQIKVSDDGVGFDATDQEKISGELALVKSRIEQEANGRMSIKSAPGQGTTVTIKLRREYTPS